MIQEEQETIQFYKYIILFIERGYQRNWGDGALNDDKICILRKIENGKTNYVIISKGNRLVEFRDVGSYYS